MKFDWYIFSSASRGPRLWKKSHAMKYIMNTCISTYGETCFERPPLNAAKGGLSRQVVSHQRSILQRFIRGGFSFCGLSSEGGLQSQSSLNTGTVEPVLRDLCDERPPSDDRSQKKPTSLINLCKVNLRWETTCLERPLFAAFGAVSQDRFHCVWIWLHIFSDCTVDCEDQRPTALYNSYEI
jgi:hypothetical protein